MGTDRHRARRGTAFGADLTISEGMSELPALEVLLREPSRETFLGLCLGIEPLGDEILASVEFLAGQAPLLQLGGKTELEFREAGEEPSVSLSAVTVLRTDHADRRCYCFRGELSKRVFMHLLDRRRSLRLRM